MNFQDLILISLRAIASNGLRSLLTTLGIIIGVSSVIILMSVGQGAVKGVIDELNALGTNLIFIEPGSSAKTTFGLTTKDLAIDTLCCWPPLNWLGLKSILSIKPTMSNAFAAFNFLSSTF